MSKLSFEGRKKTCILTYFLYWSASTEWITLIISQACTNWHMINNLAFGIVTANARTWISTMLTNASHSTGTIWIINTFRSAAGSICITDIWWDTRTSGSTIFWSTLWIFTAWRWRAGINMISLWGNGSTSSKCITSKTRQAITECWMCYHMTLCVCSASICTWIFTSFSNTCLIIWTIVAKHALRSTIWWTSNIIFYTWANWVALS